MSENDVLEERDGFRVRVVHDDMSPVPYDDGGTPVIRVRRGRVSQVEDLTSYVVPPGTLSNIQQAIDRWEATSATLARYLRIFHGAYGVETYASGEDTYLTFDLPDWRERMGLTDAYLAAQGIDPRMVANMQEWRSYCEGDTWLWVLEQTATWRKDGDPDTTMTTWDVVESCGGYYGEDDVTSAARDALSGALADAAAAT